MGNFQGGGNGGGGYRGGGGFRGGNSGGGRSNFRGGDRGEVTMHKAVCDECHKNCEVPFRPSGDKPIYCSDCFSSKKGNDDRGPKRDFNDRPTQSSFVKPAPVQNDMAKQLSDINTKLDRLTSAIERLSQTKVVEAKPVAKVASVANISAKKVIAKTSTKKVVVKNKK